MTVSSRQILLLPSRMLDVAVQKMIQKRRPKEVYKYSMFIKFEYSKLIKQEIS